MLFSAQMIPFRRLEAAPAGDPSERARLVLALLVLMLAAVAGLSVATGASVASALRVIGGWLGLVADSTFSARDQLIIEEIRLPRIALGILVGAALAVSGALMQGLFRNPLADPGIIGVSAVAGLGAISVIVLGGTVLGPVVLSSAFMQCHWADFSQRCFFTALRRGAIRHRSPLCCLPA